MKIGHVNIKVRKYADGRWGYDDYSSGKRVKVRLLTKQKAEQRAAALAVLITSGRPDLFIQNGFAPVPPARLHADGMIRNGSVVVPNQPGIYFIWEGPRVAYIGQSINLARRLVSHEHLQPNDKISYLCIDRSELLYHEAFYIGICRPSRNGGLKNSLALSAKTDIDAALSRPK